MRAIVAKNNLPKMSGRLGRRRSVVLLLALALACASFRAESAPGEVDLAFNAGFGPFFHRVVAAPVQPDGMILAGGHYFTFLSGQTRSAIARFDQNGALDMAFDPVAGDINRSTADVECVVLQDDGKILLAGRFDTVGAVPRHHLARIHANGTLDTGFDPNPNYPPFSIAMQADGKILIGGQFTTVGGVTRNRIARLNANGTLDAGFNPNVTSTIYNLPLVLGIAVHTDGKILICGDFDTVGGVACRHIARLNANGTLDPSFTPDAFEFSAYGAVVQADGKTLMMGDFNAIGGVARTYIARLHPNGALDGGFDPPNADDLVLSLAAQTDGKIVVAGSFETLGGVTRNYIARLNANGTLDANFNPNAQADVYSTVLQADGKILIGGEFRNVGGVIGAGLARLHNEVATQDLTRPNNNRVRWSRGGASPETQHVTFELSTNGGTVFTPLGGGTRINGGWELTGLTLPDSGHIRARARITTGLYNSSSGIVETLTGFGPNPNDQDNDGLLDSWELTYWPTLNGHDPQDDSEGDGYSELLELAFGLNPTAPDPGGLPPVTTEGDYLTMTITKHAGVIYEVQSAGTLLPGQPDSFSAATTTVLINNATTLKVRDNFPTATSPPRFMRVKVTAAP